MKNGELLPTPFADLPCDLVTTAVVLVGLKCHPESPYSRPTETVDLSPHGIPDLVRNLLIRAAIAVVDQPRCLHRALGDAESRSTVAIVCRASCNRESRTPATLSSALPSDDATQATSRTRIGPASPAAHWPSPMLRFPGTARRLEVKISHSRTPPEVAQCGEFPHFGSANRRATRMLVVLFGGWPPTHRRRTRRTNLRSSGRSRA